MSKLNKTDKKSKALRKKETTIFLVFIIIPLFIAFLLGEILVRKFSKLGYMTPEILKSKSLQYERSIFTRNAFPQAEQKLRVNNADIYINKKGYRGRDFEIKKPKGKIRIIFYGGSSVFNADVSERQDWPHRVEDLLHEKGFTQIEVINAGIPTNRSFESWGRLFAEGHIFSPDYVVLSNQYNDMKYFREDKPVLRQFNWFLEEKDPFITYQNALDRFLCEHSQLYIRLRTRYYLWTYKPAYEGAPPLGEYSDKITDLGLAQYKLSLEMFVDLARNIEAIPVLMTEPRLVDSSNTEEEKKRIKYVSTKLTHKALYDAFKKTDEIVEEVGKEKNVIVIDASEKISGRGELFVDHVHTTVEGSEEVAKIVADKFVEILNHQ